MPPWPRRVSEPMMPGPGPAIDRVPAELLAAASRAPGDRDRLVLAAVGGRGGDVAAEQAALAQLGDVAAERAGQGAARRLHVADLEPGDACAAAQAAGARCPCSGRTSTGIDTLAPFRCAFLHPRHKRRTGSSTGSTGC